MFAIQTKFQAKPGYNREINQSESHTEHDSDCHGLGKRFESRMIMQYIFIPSIQLVLSELLSGSLSEIVLIELPQS